MRILQAFTTTMMNQVQLTSFTPKLIYPAVRKKQKDTRIRKKIWKKKKVGKNAAVMMKKMTRI